MTGESFVFNFNKYGHAILYFMNCIFLYLTKFKTQRCYFLMLLNDQADN